MMYIVVKDHTIGYDTMTKLSYNFIGYCDSDGKLNNKGIYGYRWSASSKDKNNAQNFKFNKDKGKLNRNNRNLAMPVRPVLKHSYLSGPSGQLLLFDILIC